MQKKRFRPLLIALGTLIVISSSLSYGQSTTINTDVPVTKSSKKADKKPDDPSLAPFGILVTGSHSQSLTNFQDGTLKQSNDFEFSPSYKWKDQLTMLYWTYSQDVVRPENSDIGDVYLIHSFKGFDFSRIKLVPTMIGILPESKESREKYNLETSVGGKLAASIQERLLIPGFTFATAVSLARNFHRYDTATDGKPNSAYSSRQSIITGYEFGIFSINGEFHHINKWTYSGTMGEGFEHTEEASVSMGDHYAFTLGHTNAGSMLKANARDSNLSFVDENSSLVYAKVSMKY
jgi:hypothetical protein